ncbi:hypothetical protein CCH79_00011250 [Gambusia affinis]|uniref:Uncharacterized protein n=1 Tax=Gambusia affinis TaxID=33528 RepID=A0A315V623_GAMAF|nr:hypothetical protein CCH79_00011250 [Gambusia affinis]
MQGGDMRCGAICFSISSHTGLKNEDTGRGTKDTRALIAKKYVEVLLKTENVMNRFWPGSGAVYNSRGFVGSKKRLGTRGGFAVSELDADLCAVCLGRDLLRLGGTLPGHNRKSPEDSQEIIRQQMSQTLPIRV